MSFPKDQIEELKRVYGCVSSCDEGNIKYLLIPDLILPEGCLPKKVEALFCPTARDGYPSRLFFAEIIRSNLARNWHANGFRVIERNWQVFSWKVNQPNLRLIQILRSHLKALE